MGVGGGGRSLDAPAVLSKATASPAEDQGVS